jgi:hypothetical protein
MDTLINMDYTYHIMGNIILFGSIRARGISFFAISHKITRRFSSFDEDLLRFFTVHPHHLVVQKALYSNY